MPLSRFRQVVIFCPLAVTGGPEAIHQLCQSINAIGVDCYLIHIGTGHETRLVDGRLTVLHPPNARLVQAYSSYGPRFLQETVLDERTLVILPEGLARHNRGFKSCGVAVWWLSVDNAFRGLEAAGVNVQAHMDQILSRPDLIHLYQSAYARDWLRERGIERLYDLSDYTSPLYASGVAKEPSPRPTVSYNGAKGAELAQAFFAEIPQFEALALRGFTKPELLNIFRERLLYVDFGHFPGKDRLPREAALGGSVVFVHSKGAAASYEDFPLPDFYKFTEADVTSGVLRQRLEAVAADPRGHWARQDHFRGLVTWEKAQFHDQVLRLWGVRRSV